jgi:hypothetical protein
MIKEINSIKTHLRPLQQFQESIKPTNKIKFRFMVKQ